MLFINSCTWAHIVAEAARLLEIPRENLLTEEEMAAIDGKVCPEGIVV
jgi:hypothetical protein